MASWHQKHFYLLSPFAFTQSLESSGGMAWMEPSMSLKGRQPRAPKLFVGALLSQWKVLVLTTWASWLLWQGRDPSIHSCLLLGQIKERLVAGLLSVSLLSCGHPLSTSCSVPDTVPRATELRGTHDSFPPEPPGFLPLRALTGFYSSAPSLGGKSPKRVHALQVCS